MYRPKIYLAASIRGGRENKKYNQAARQVCDLYGDVVTPHVGDPKLTRYGEKGISNYKINSRDEELLKSADLVIADVTTSSTGLGIELGSALVDSKKVLCISKYMPRGRRISPQVSGNSYWPLIYYRDQEEMEKIIKSYLEGLGCRPKDLIEKEREFS